MKYHEKLDYLNQSSKNYNNAKLRPADMDEYKGNYNAWDGDIGMKKFNSKNIHAYRKKLDSDFKSHRNNFKNNLETRSDNGVPDINKQLEFFFPTYYPTHNTPIFKHPNELLAPKINDQNEINVRDEIDAVSTYEPKREFRREDGRGKRGYEEMAPHHFIPPINTIQQPPIPFYYPPQPPPQQPIIIEREKYSKRNLQAEKLSEAFGEQTKAIKGILAKIEEKHTKKHDIDKEYLKHKISLMENEVFMKGLQQEQENFMFAVKDSLDEFTNNMMSQNMRQQQQPQMPNMYGQMNPYALNAGGWNGFPNAK